MSQPDFSAYDPKVASETLLLLYENAYRFEINRKDATNTRLSFPIAMFTLIIGAIAFFIKDAPHFHNDPTSYFFYLLLFFLIISLGFALYFFCKTLFGYRYAYLRPLGEIDTVVRKIKKYNNQVSERKKRDTGHKLTVFLLEQYRSSADINRDLNKQKSGYFLRTLRALFISILFLFFTTVPCLISKNSLPEKVHKVEVVNFLNQGLNKPTIKEEQIMAEDNEREPTTDEDLNSIEWPEGPERVEEADVKPSKIVEKTDADLTETIEKRDESE